MNRRVLTPPIAIVCFLALASLLRAAPAPEKPDAPTSAAKEGAKPVVREQTIYIPYEKLRKTFEKEGRGVFLPYEKFRELWDAAREATRTPEDEEPPQPLQTYPETRSKTA